MKAVPILLAFISPRPVRGQLSPDFVDEAHVVGSYSEHINIGFLKGRFTPAMV